MAHSQIVHLAENGETDQLRAWLDSYSSGGSRRSSVVNSRDDDQSTALHKACEKGHVDMVAMLLERGANVNLQGRDGETPLLDAILNEDHENIAIVRLLLEAGANLHAVDHYGETALHWASERGHAGVVSLLLTTAAQEQRQKTKRKKWMKKQRCEGSSSSSLMRAVTTTMKRIMTAINQDDEKDDKKTNTAAAVVDHVVNARNRRGRTPLFEACARGHVNVVDLLLQYGGRVAIADKDGRTPLHEACQHGHVPIVQRLLSSSLLSLHDDANSLPSSSCSSSSSSSSSSPPLSFSSLGSPMAAAAQAPQHQQQHRLALLHGAMDWRGRTPLFDAAARGHVHVVAQLLEAGADVTVCDTARTQTTTTTTATRTATTTMTAFAATTTMTTTTTATSTPLHLAMKGGHLEVMQILILAWISRGGDRNYNNHHNNNRKRLASLPTAT